MSAAVELSIVCAMRDVAHCVEGLLDSYRREGTTDTQLIIVDCDSTDGTWEILQHNRDIIDVAISEPDRGIYDAWNKALPMCKGRFVSFIGADDRIAHAGISQLLATCKSLQGDPHVIAGFNILTRKGMPVALLGEPYKPDYFHKRMMIAHVLSAHRLDWLVTIGGFDSSYKSSGDYELLLRDRATLRITVINAILAYMEDGGVSRTSLRPFYESYRARLSNGVPRLLCAVLLIRALVGVVARKVGLRR